MARARIDPIQAPGGAQTAPKGSAAAPAVSMATDGTVGLYVSQASMAGVAWHGLPTPALQVTTWNPATRVSTLWTSGTLGLVQIPNGVRGTIPGGITVDATWVADGDAIDWSVVVTNTGSLAVFSADWPRIRIQAPSSSTYLAIPIWAGFVKASPAADTRDNYFSAPAMLGFMGYYDGMSGLQFYAEKRDDTGYLADFHFQGDGAAGTTISIRHFCGANKTAGNSWTQPYTVRTKTIRGKGDGRSGYVDAAAEYRSWALAKDEHGAYLRPWVPAGRWWERTDYSSRVANAKLFIAHQDGAAGAPSSNPPSWSTYLTDLQRTKAFLGAAGGDILNVIYLWHGNVFDVNVPAHTPSRAGYAAHLANVVAEGAHPIPYVNIAYWDLDLTSGTYNAANYSAFGDVRAYLVKDDTQAVQHDGNGLAVLDPSFGVVSAVWLDLLTKYYVDAPTAPHGWYFDQLGGTTTSLTFNYSNGLAANKGNNGQWASGKRACINGVMGASKIADPAAVSITEQMEEATLGVEACLATQNIDPTTFGLGCQAGIGAMVYGQFQRRLDFSVQFGDPTNPSQAFALAQQVIGHWLDGGILGYHNGAVGMTVPSLNNADPTQAALYYTFLVMKSLFDAHARALPAFKGIQQRPLRGSWQYQALDSGQSLAAYLQGVQLTYPSSVWKTDDGKLWVVVVNHNTSDPLRLRFRVADYDIDETTPRILYRDVGAGAQPVGTYLAEVDYFDVPPTGVTVYSLI